jgi:peroxiredoxin
MLKEKQKAPDFELPALTGESQKLFTDDNKMTLITFYKYNCPTCQLALPYMQRIYEAYGDAFRILAVAQDGPERTSDFVKDYKLTMPVLMDEAPYSVSQKYGLEVVPTIFLMNSDHTIRYAGDGFVKQDLLNLADVLAEKSGRPQIDLFGSDPVPEIKPG